METSSDGLSRLYCGHTASCLQEGHVRSGHRAQNALEEPRATAELVRAGREPHAVEPPHTKTRHGHGENYRPTNARMQI